MESLEANKHSEENKSADTIKQNSLELYLSNDLSKKKKIHLHKHLILKNSEIKLMKYYCLTFFLMSSNFELYIYSSS